MCTNEKFGRGDKFAESDRLPMATTQFPHLSACYRTASSAGELLDRNLGVITFLMTLWKVLDFFSYCFNGLIKLFPAGFRPVSKHKPCITIG